MLPNINNKTAVPIERFVVNLESIEDLFYDKQSSIDHKAELKRVQVVLNKNIEKINEIYSRNGDSSMDKLGFERFVEKSIGIGGSTADEIFSCCTGLYSSEDGKEVGEDKFMSRSEFATGIVRLANLYSLMCVGMSDTSELAQQTSFFLSSL